MRKWLSLLAFSVFSVGMAQSSKFLATSFSVQEKRGVDWTEWSAPEESKISIILDETKDRVVVYSQEVQLYRINTYHEVIENENEILYTMSCVDESGWPIRIMLMVRKNQNNRKQLYIYQGKFTIVYNLEEHP